jgi:N-acetylneuraminic acid mutarotase
MPPVSDSTPHPRSNSSRTTAKNGSPAPGTLSSSVWKLALPSLITAVADQPRGSAANADRDAIASPPSSTSPSPMSSFANALAMKKRLSDSITDSWSRRRPSLPQGATPPAIQQSSSSRYSRDSPSINSSASSKSRSRASSAATPTSAHSTRGPPSLNSQPSLATIASTSSSVSSSSYRGGLSRQDSYSDIVSRGYAAAPLASIPSRGSTPGEDSPTVPSALDQTVRNVSSQPIANLAELRQAEEHGEFHGGHWEDPMAEGFDATVQAAADVGMRRVGVTRKISDSRRIMTPVLDHGDGEFDFGEEDESTAMDTPRTNRESQQSAAPSSIYEMSSDDESTTSSVGTGYAAAASSTKEGFPGTTSFAQRPSRGAGYQLPPPLELQTSAIRPSTANAAAVDRQMSVLSRPQSSMGPSLRSVASSPLKSGVSSASMKARAGLEVPGASDEAGTLRMSSSAGKVTPTTDMSSAASSRAHSTNISTVARSDSNSSTASTSASVQTARTNTPSSSQRMQVSSRDRSGKAAIAAIARNKTKNRPSLEPAIPDPSNAPKVDPAPASGMYWYKAPTHGLEHKPLRAHTCTLVGSNIYVFGGCDLTTCFNAMHVFDADSMSWSKPQVYGKIPPPLRAMTCTAVRNKLVIFGGGDGPTYYNDVYVFDTTTLKYTRPEIVGGQKPCPRRAHTACLYKNGIYVFGGGDGVRALNDVWRLDVTDLNKPSWKLISPASVSSSAASTRSNATSSNAVDRIKPHARGYHTANMVGSKLIVYGGSDGDDCFKDVWVFDVETALWRMVDIKKSFSRLSHSATVIGSYLFVVGGHDGVQYSSEVLLLNLGMSTHGCFMQSEI